MAVYVFEHEVGTDSRRPESYIDTDSCVDVGLRRWIMAGCSNRGGTIFSFSTSDGLKLIPNRKRLWQIIQIKR